jgi:hypothetical protein
MKSNDRYRLRSLSVCARLSFHRGLVLAAVFAAALPAVTVAEELRNHFDSDAMMRPPAFFDLVILGDTGADSAAKWLVLVDKNPPSAPNALVQTSANRSDSSIAAALRRSVAFQDGTVSTFVKKAPGHSGLVLRFVDEKNFLLVLADTSTGEIVVTQYVDGQPSELGRGGQGAFARGWEQIGAVLAGPSVAVTLNEKKIFEATDPKPASGRVGLATKGPGEARFDELKIFSESSTNPQSRTPAP